MNFIKVFFKSFNVAFSLYSRIPMPKFEWTSDDMKYHLCFFPFVGAVIGLIEYFWYIAYLHFGFTNVLYFMFSLAIPIIVTGGFHLDGFLDTQDALNSFADKEKKLEILKDSHIGAFSVINLLLCILLSVGFIFQIDCRQAVITLCFSFFISRCLSALSVTYFPKAKKDGMVHTSSSTENKKAVGLCLILELVLSVVVLLFLSSSVLVYAVSMFSAFTAVFIYYFCMSKKLFGGITGDLAGFFVVVSELASLIAVSICCIVVK